MTENISLIVTNYSNKIEFEEWVSDEEMAEINCEKLSNWSCLEKPLKLILRLTFSPIFMYPFKSYRRKHKGYRIRISLIRFMLRAISKKN